MGSKIQEDVRSILILKRKALQEKKWGRPQPVNGYNWLFIIKNQEK
jgi:hypothetical protein